MSSLSDKTNKEGRDFPEHQTQKNSTDQALQVSALDFITSTYTLYFFCKLHM